MLLIFVISVNCPGSLHAGDAVWYGENYITFVSHHFLYEGMTLRNTSFIYIIYTFIYIVISKPNNTDIAVMLC